MARPINLLGGDVLGKIQNMHREVERNRRRIVLAGARAAAEHQKDAGRADSGGDMVLSGTKRRGRPPKRINVTVRASGTGNRTVAIVKATGPWPLIDRDTPGHVIRSAYVTGAYRGSRGRGQIFGPAAPAITGGRRAVLNIPGVGFRRSARHPGTKGKGTWQKGKGPGMRAADVEVERETKMALVRTFRAGLR